MKEEIKRATNNAKKDDLLELLSTISQLVEVRKNINKKFDEIVEVLKKSKYADEEDVMRKFQLLRAKMQRSSGELGDLNELIDSIRKDIQKEADV
jgi:tRNA C32,U32 (ribose-2'-O)-methylase TrmJ